MPREILRDKSGPLVRACDFIDLLSARPNKVTSGKMARDRESHNLSAQAFVESHPSRKKRDSDGVPHVQLSYNFSG